jgi:hypothetical protein
VDPSIATLTNQGMAYRPLMTGYDHHRLFPTQGLPFTGGPMGSFAAMGLTPQLMRMTGQVGMFPMGLGHDQNVYDRLMNERFTATQIQAISLAAEADRRNYSRTFRGLAAATGTPFGADQRRAADSLSGSFAAMSPLFAEMMPDFLDRMGGTRGSSAVMAKRMVDFGRYRLDPVTGRMGMSGDTTGFMANRLYGDLFSDAGLPGMRGMTAGQTGSLVGELQMRGMIGSAATESRFGGFRADDPRASTMRAIRDMGEFAPTDLRRAAQSTGVDLTRPGGITAGDLDKLTLDPAVATKLRTFDVERVKTSVKSYVGVVTAMRDIFGDMGKPNAPMAELIAGVEALTMGGMGRIDPGRMPMMVRQTYNLAKQTGVTMDNVMLMQQHAASRAQQMGLEPAFAVQATQGSLAFGGAFRAQGHAGHHAWGAFSADQVQQLDSNLRIQAASSNVANRMAVAARLAEQIGGFAPDSEAGRFVAAVRTGSGQYRSLDGGLRSVSMGDRDFTRMLTAASGRDGRGAGISEGDVQTLLQQRDTNREYVERLGISNTVRRIQGTDELHPFVGDQLQHTLTSRLRDSLVARGVGTEDAGRRARTASTAVSQNVARRMFDMSTEEFSDTTSRNRAVAGLIREELETSGQGGVLEGMTQNQQDDFLTQSADRFYGAANRSIRGSMYRSFGNLQNVHRLTNKSALDEADRQQMEARFKAEMQEAMAPLGRGSMLQRAVDALQGLRPDDPRGAAGVIGQMLGGVRIEDINRAILPQIRKVADQRTAVEELQQRMAKELDPQERNRLTDQLDVMRRQLGGQAADLSKLGGQFGLFGSEGVGREDVLRALGSTRGLMVAQNDTVGLRGAFGGEVTAGQIADFQAALGAGTTGLSAEERAAIVAGRKQQSVDAIRGIIQKGGKLEGPLKDRYDRAAATAASVLQGREIGGAGVQKLALDILQDDVRTSTETDLAGIGAVSADDARVIIRGRRRRVPFSASPAMIADIRKEFPNVTEEEAADIANARLRARRLGVSESEIRDRQASGRYGGAYGEVAAIADVFSDRSGRMFDITDADIDSLKRSEGYRDPSQEERDRFRGENQMEGDEAAVTKEMQRRMVFKQRQDSAKQRFAKFWGSVEGAAFRDQVGLATGDVDTIAEKLVASPESVQRLGSRAVEMSETLRADQQRLRDLSLFHTGGDLARLMARDFGDLKAKTPEEARDLTEKLNREITDIQYRQREFLSELGGDSQGGRRFQMGDSYAARKRVLDAEVRAGRMTRADADRALAGAVSPGANMRIEAMRRELGSDAAVRQTLGIDPGDRNLNSMQRAAIAGLRFGAGSEDEARLVFGEDRWDALSPGDRAATTARLRSGLGTDAQAAEFLGITEAMLKDDRDGVHGMRIAAARVGLGSDAHVAQLLPRRPGESDTDYATRTRAAKMGLYNPALARERLGMPADPMPERLLPLIDQEREREGNEAEALRLLGKKPGEKLTQDDLAKLKQLTYDVGVSRRVMPGDERTLLEFEGAQDKLQRMAESRGLTRQQVESRGDALVLGEPQAERQSRAAIEHKRREHNLTGLQRGAAEIRHRLEKLGDNLGDGRNSQREAMQAQLKGIEAEIVKEQKAMSGIESGISADAEAVGVSPQDYLKGKGFMDRAGLGLFKNAADRRDALAKQVEGIATGLGLKPEDLAGVTGISRKLLETQKKAADRQGGDPTELGRGLLGAFGFKTGDAPDQFEQSLGRLLGDPRVAGFAKRAVESQKGLQEIAKRRAGGPEGAAGVDEMASSYFKAIKTGKAADMEAFRRTFGLWDTDSHGQLTGASNSDFDRFQKDMQFQQQTGLLGVGADRSPHRSLSSRQDLAKLITQASRDGSNVQGAAGGGSGRMELSGTVTLRSDGTIDMSGAYAGGRNFPLAGGSD